LRRKGKNQNSNNKSPPSKSNKSMVIVCYLIFD